ASRRQDDGAGAESAHGARRSVEDAGAPDGVAPFLTLDDQIDPQVMLADLDLGVALHGGDERPLDFSPRQVLRMDDPPPRVPSLASEGETLAAFRGRLTR